MISKIKKAAQAFFKRVVPSVLVVTTAAACAPRGPVFMPVQDDGRYSQQPYQANRFVVERSRSVGKDPYTRQRICEDVLYDSLTGDIYNVQHGCNVSYDPRAVVGQFEEQAERQTSHGNPAANVANFVLGVGVLALTVALLHPGHGRHHGRHYYYRHHR